VENDVPLRPGLRCGEIAGDNSGTIIDRRAGPRLTPARSSMTDQPESVGGVPASAFALPRLLGTLGQAVIATDLDGVIRYWNAAAEKLYGWTAAEVVGRDIVDVTVPQMSQEMAEDVMAALRAGEAWSGGFAVQRRDGSVFSALVTDAGVYAEDGALVGIVGVSTNLGSALRPLLERSSDAALVLTTDAVVRYASPAVRPLFGWQPDELLGKTLTALIDARDQGDLYRALHERLPDLPSAIELRVLAAGGTVAVEASFTDLRDDSVVRGVVCNLRHSERLTRLRERTRISEAAHADILQTLFGARLELAVAQRAAASPEEHQRLEAAGEQIGDAIAALRRLLDPDAGQDGEPDEASAPV
jgi:PAS domain S-box-containing protein